MPSAAMGPCRRPGCPALVKRGEGGYCARHRAAADAADRQWRGNAAERGYDGRWQKIRAAHLAEFPLCGMRSMAAERRLAGREFSRCREERRHTPATEVDHIDGHDGPSDPKFDDPSNLESLCKRCHSRKTAITAR